MASRTTPAIPFNKPSFAGAENEYIAQAIANGHISGDGPFGKTVEALFQEELGVARALLTTSCTDALELAALVLGVGPGDEVVMPAFTFVSTANAFVLRGAKPVFVDVRPDTLNLDEERLEAAITPATRAIVVVHYAGVACEMDRIGEIAAKHGIPVVEDNAHGLFARYKGRLLGTLGVLATQSFHETKNFTCGEGGALLINDPRSSNVPRSFAIKEPTVPAFFAGRSTSIRGSTLARATSCPTCWRRSCSRSSRRARRSSRNANEFGEGTKPGFGHGRNAPASSCRRSRRTASRPTISFIFFFRGRTTGND